MSRREEVEGSAGSGARPMPADLVEMLRRRAGDREGGHFFFEQPPDRPAHLSYAMLDDQARRIAARLQRQGAKGERVLLLYPPGLDFVAAYFGCLYAGAIAVPAYPPDPLRLDRTLPRLVGIVRDATPRFVSTTRAILSLAATVIDRAPDLERPTWLASDGLSASLAESWEEPGIDPQDVAFLQYTSGSTGEPKGVEVTHANVLANSSLIRDAFGREEQGGLVNWLPQYHDLGLMSGVIAPIHHGAPVWLMSPIDFLKDPGSWLQVMSKTGAVCSGGPNFAFDFCVRRVQAPEREKLDLSRWRIAFTAGEPIRPETLDRFCEAFGPCGFREEAFQPCYGLAEATLLVTSGARGAGAVIRRLDAAALERGEVSPAVGDGRVASLVSCGRGLPGQRVEIVDPDTRRMRAADQIGEIWIGGPSVARGYWGRGEASDDVFRARIAVDREGEPLLRSGDLGFMDAEGELYVTGRIKELIIIRGKNHVPQDIEATVEQTAAAIRPGCSAAFSVSREEGEALVVVCEVDGAAAPDLEELRGAVNAAILANHDLAATEIAFIEARSLPKTSSGKVRRLATRDAYEKGELSRAPS